MTRLFGTDGVRGVANRDLSPELAFKLGKAGAHVLACKTGGRQVVIGRDTRISGTMLESALAAGICSAGLDVLQAGILPTPAIAYLTRELKASAGVVISASHNPVEDNGIKFFASNGYKLPDAVEDEIEALINDGFEGIPLPKGVGVGKVQIADRAEDLYVQFAKQASGASLSGMKIVVDCANGAAYNVAPRIFSELGAQVEAIFAEPDGANINDNCGSTHPEKLCERVKASGAGMGLAFDGDADRLIAVDENGNIVDGDKIMYICACWMKEQGRLDKNTVVVTVMSNMGLHCALKDEGISILETKVGDRYVMEEMLRTGAVLGGEQSGHIIFLKNNTTGDGIITALQLLSAVKSSGKTLGELASRMECFPQVLKNVKVLDKEKVMKSPALVESVNYWQQRLNGEGRILVRPSGTEPVVRVMVECRDPGMLELTVNKLVEVVGNIS